MNFCISFVWPDPLHCLLSFSTSQFFCCSGVCLSWKFSESEGRHRKLNAGENSFNSDNVSVPLHISYFFHFVCSLQRYRWWRVNFQWNFTFVRRLTLNFICLVLWSTTNIGQCDVFKTWHIRFSIFVTFPFMLHVWISHLCVNVRHVTLKPVIFTREYHTLLMNMLVIPEIALTQKIRRGRPDDDECKCEWKLTIAYANTEYMRKYRFGIPNGIHVTVVIAFFVCSFAWHDDQSNHQIRIGHFFSFNRSHSDK